MTNSGLEAAPSLALARPVQSIPLPARMPGGTRYEPKWDGYRVAIGTTSEGVMIWSRNATDLTGTFPDLASAIHATLPAGLLLDGEAVVWENGRLSFDALQQRLGSGVSRVRKLARQQPASFVAFDLLAVAGRDIRHHAWSLRRQLLEELASEWKPPLNLSPVTDDIEVAREWFDSLAAAGVEGLVAKGAAQPYVGGQRDWLKVKRRETVDVVLAAVIGPRERPEAVVVGLPDENGLRIVGRSAPLRGSEAARIGAELRAPTHDHPWPEVVSPGAVDRFNAGREPIHLTLVEPVVAEISADVAMSGRAFRHAVRLVRLRPDLDVDQVKWPAAR